MLIAVTAGTFCAMGNIRSITPETRHIFPVSAKSACDSLPSWHLLPIGAYNPPQFRNVHTSPGDATRAFLDLNSHWMVPMHYGTFQLSHEPMDEPLQLLDKEARRAGIEEKVLVLPEGITKIF